MSYIYDNLVTPRNTTSGIADFILLAPTSAFIDIKCPEAPFTNPGDEVKIRAAHEFVETKGFIKVLLAPEKNKLDLETVGDKGFQKFNQKLNCFIAGSYAEVHEAIKNWLNKPLILLTKDSNCDENLWYQIGCDCEASYMTAKFGTSTTNEGVKGYEVEFSVMTNYVALYAPVDGEGDPIDPLSQVIA